MDPVSYRRHRFPPPIIQHAIWLYLRFTLSYRDVEELLAERGIEVSYETIRRWVLSFGPLITRRLRALRPSTTAGTCELSLTRRGFVTLTRLLVSTVPPVRARLCNFND